MRVHKEAKVEEVSFCWNSNAFLTPERLTDVTPWHGHLPFAFWIVEAAAPDVLVELGVHKGDSYFGFCQAVAAKHLNTRCFGVDTWKGDEHAGLYGEEIFAEFNAYNESRFSGFSVPLRMLFSEALDIFPDGSIDLLHIDGYHSYEAVAMDFESWLPKMSERGVVLLHDIAVRERGFGVWKFWDEAKERFPSFGFSHSYGLGVLGVGSELPAELADFFAYAKLSPGSTGQVFAVLGNRCRLMSEAQARSQEIAELHNLQESTAIELDQARSELDQARSELEEKRREWSDTSFRMEQQLSANDELLESLSLELAEVRAELGTTESVAAELEGRFREAAAQRDEILNAQIWRATAPLRWFLTTIKRAVGKANTGNPPGNS